MEVQDFSLEFDLLYNNIFSNQSPGLTEFEKSLLLTEAQEAIVKDLYSGAYTSFEATEQTTAYLSTISKKYTAEHPIGEGYTFKFNSYFFDIPDDVWFITLEEAQIQVEESKCHPIGTKNIKVIPMKQDEFYKAIENPFRWPTDRKILRLTTSNDDSRVSELVSAIPILTYTIRYLQKPEPIVLEDNIQIDGKVYNAQTCKLPESLHRDILLRAVQLAKAVWA